MRLSYKLILAFLLVSLLPMLFLAQMNLSEIEEFGLRVQEQSRLEMYQLTEKAVQQKADDVAKQLEIYLRELNQTGLNRLFNNPYLRGIAVQKIGKNGYTAVHRRDGVVLFHQQQRLEGRNLLEFGPGEERFFSDFTVLFSKSLESDIQVYGYYQWLEDGQMMRKYMAVSPILNTDYLLAATIPAEEFDVPLMGFNKSFEKMKRDLWFFFYAVAGLLLGIAIICGFAVSIAFTRPIGRLQKGLMAFSRGDLLYRIPVRTRDELGTLSLMFNEMAEDLSQKNRQLVEKTRDVEASEYKYRQLVENLHDVAAYIDEDWNVTFISPGITERLGYLPEELVGTHILELIHAEDISYVEAQVRQATGMHQRSSKLEFRILHKNGAYHTLNVRVSFLYESDALFGSVAVARDVTEERNMESQIRLLSLAFQQLGDGLLVCNLEGNVIVSNPTWARMHGFSSKDELVDRNINAFHPDSEAMLLQEIMQAVQMEGKWTGEVRHRRKDDSTFLSLSVYSRLQDTAGRDIGYVVVSTDITERKRVEDTLRQHSDDLEILVQQRTKELQEKAEELEDSMHRSQDADSLKSEFLMRVSHELRTPLNSILGFSKLLLRSGEDELAERQRFDVELIHQNSLYLLELINGILDLSKIESGMMTLFREEFDLSELVSDTLRTLQPMADLSRIELDNRLQGRVIPLYADREKVRQILFNLLSNAVKFTHEGEVEISERQTPDTLTLSVRDTGIGIAPTDQQRAFDKFVQIASPMHGRFMGTGLGLTIARSFVDMHNGKMWIESQVGVGSTFFIQLPKIRPEDVAIDSEDPVA